MATELPKCELCGAAVEPPRKYPAINPVRLAGLCEKCSGKLGGGPYSAAVVRAELRAMKRANSQFSRPCAAIVSVHQSPAKETDSWNLR